MLRYLLSTCKWYHNRYRYHGRYYSNGTLACIPTIVKIPTSYLILNLRSGSAFLRQHPGPRRSIPSGLAPCYPLDADCFPMLQCTAEFPTFGPKHSYCHTLDFTHVNWVAQNWISICNRFELTYGSKMNECTDSSTCFVLLTGSNITASLAFAHVLQTSSEDTKA